jgi:hypothetical protein
MTARKLIALVLVLTFLGLAVDLRYEHAGVTAWWAWMPRVFPIVAFIFGLMCWVCWEAGDDGARSVLLGLFVACFVVAGLGFMAHCHCRPLEALKSVLMPDGSPEGPPLLAPMAFALIGTLGVLACWKNKNRG